MNPDQAGRRFQYLPTTREEILNPAIQQATGEMANNQQGAFQTYQTYQMGAGVRNSQFFTGNYQYPQNTPGTAFFQYKSQDEYQLFLQEHQTAPISARFDYVYKWDFIEKRYKCVDENRLLATGKVERNEIIQFMQGLHQIKIIDPKNRDKQRFSYLLFLGLLIFLIALILFVAFTNQTARVFLIILMVLLLALIGITVYQLLITKKKS